MYNNINPSESIQKLVTPVATPWSVRPGFFNASGHTTVCQTVFFKYFRLGHQWPYHSLTDGSVIWSLTSYVEKVTEKKTVCETEVWLLAGRVKNLNTASIVHQNFSLLMENRHRC